MADEANTAQFSISEDGETSGTRWVGKFRAKKKLSLRDQLNRDKVKRELLGTMGGIPDPRPESIAIIVAELSVRLVEAPDWWRELGNGLDMEDGNVVTKIWDEALKVQEDYDAERRKRAEEARGVLKEKQVQDQKEAAK